MTMRNRVECMLDKTRNAYSFERYGENGWRDCIKYLFSENYNEYQVEAILRSKHMRWAADNAGDVRCYDMITLVDYLQVEYWDKRGHSAWQTEVAQLVAETFPNNNPNKKQGAETDLAFARRNASDVIAALREVLHVLESNRLTKQDGIQAVNLAMAMQISVVDYLNAPGPENTFAEYDKLQRENADLKSNIDSIRRNAEGILKFYPLKI